MLSEVLKSIRENGYKNTVSKLETTFPKIDSELKKNYQDLIFHGITKNNSRCLNIGSNLGNTCKQLSFYFQEVISIDSNSQKIEFQKKRFESENISNVTFFNLNYENLSFPEAHFDLIFLENLEFIIQNTNNFDLEQFFVNLKNMLTNEGCIVFGIKNQSSKNSNAKLDLSVNFCKNLLSKTNLIYNAFWVYPSLEHPSYSAPLENSFSGAWFLKNLDNFKPTFKKKTLKTKFFPKSLKFFPTKLFNHFFNKYSPATLFCCSKKKVTTLHELIQEKSSSNDFLLMSRKFKIMYILFQEKSNPISVYSFDKINSDIFMTKINLFQNIKQDKNLSKNNWVVGRPIDPLNYDEILLSVKWLLNFQKENQFEIISKEEINKKSNDLKSIFETEKTLLPDYIFTWLNDYNNFILDSEIRFTSVHGDLSHKNMIFDKNTGSVEVIDWYHHKEKGDPLYDISAFIFRFLIKSKNFSKEKSLENKLNSPDTHFLELKITLEKMISEHFSKSMSLLFLTKYFLLLTISKKIEQKTIFDDDLKFAKIIYNFETENSIS